MRRREFIVLAAVGATIWPLVSSAQKAPILIGFLGSQAPPKPSDAQGNAIIQGFLDNGLVPGRDFILEPHFTNGLNDRFETLAKELALKGARVILSNNPAAVRAVQRLDPPMPVVMTNMNDPVGNGLIISLAHPGNRTTGTASLNADVTPKLLEFVREILPKATVLASLFNPSNPSNPALVDNLIKKAAPLGIKIVPFEMKSIGELDEVLAAIIALHPDALQILSDPLLSDSGDKISEVALANLIPAFSTSDATVEAGGLVRYGASVRKVLRRTGYYVKKILDGANAGDLPVEQPTRLELVINLKNAKMLGIEIPATLLNRADQVIE
jgi:putative tryptophan/tyrosine transport system substrate-binding protein